MRKVALYDKADRRAYLISKASDPLAWERGGPNSLRLFGPSWKTADEAQKYNRLRTGMKGKGDYKGWSIFGPGSFSGNKISAGNWGGAGKYRKKRRFVRRRNFRGRGDYGGDAGGNQIMAGSISTPMTVNSSTKDLSGDICLSHREFLGNVQALVPASGLSLFNVTAFPLNVGLPASFPWLAQIAQNFTLYDFEGLIFEYKPTSGELGSTSNQLGKVVMATQYDPDAPQFTSAVQMENYDYANSCKPSEHMMHGCETAPKQTATNMLYVRAGPSAKDKVFTDLGLFQIATEGIPVTGTAGSFQQVGELWVSYKVRLSRSQIFQSTGASLQADYFYGVANTTLFDNSASAISGSAALSAIYNSPTVSTAPGPKKTNNIGVTVVSGSSTGAAFTFPVNINIGTYRVMWIADDTGASAAVAGTPTGVTNCTLTTVNTASGVTTGGGTVWFAPYSGVSSAGKWQSVIVNITAPGSNQASFQLNWTASIRASGCASAIYIEQLNPTSVIGLA